MPKLSIVITTFNRKKQLEDLLNSILASSYPKKDLEIIVVDDASADGTSGYISEKFPNLKIIRNEKELLTSESRNIGIRSSKADFVFVVDDDNVLDPDCIRLLIEKISENPEIAVLMPAISHSPDSPSTTSVKRNMVTSVTTIIKGAGQELVETFDCPNAFMIRKKALDEVGLFDSVRFPIHYEEADLGERIRKAGYGIYCYTKAKTLHKPNAKNPKLDSKTVDTPLRAYFTGRNRLIFHQRHSKTWQFILFILIFYPLVTLYYIYLILRYSNHKERMDLLSAFLRGNLAGLGFLLFPPHVDAYKSQ